MTHNQITDHVRQFIQDRFRELGAVGEDGLSETLLVRGGFYCGRRFNHDPFSAVWFIEEHEVKVYDADGGVVEVHRLGEVPDYANLTPDSSTSDEDRSELLRRAA